jgi:hypothetical protein
MAIANLTLTTISFLDFNVLNSEHAYIKHFDTMAKLMYA